MSTRLLRPGDRAEQDLGDRSARPVRRGSLSPQWLVVAAAVLFNYWFLRAVAAPVAYLNDSSVHEQMVRFATSRIEAGHLPQTSWFPYLGLGSPQFLHYQSLPSTITGLVGVVIGPDRAFAWSLYLLLSLWPVSVYVGSRAFRLGRWTSAMAALLSPLLMSRIGIGFEAIAYVWIGFGVWAQLWAMLTLPLAWGFSWQAITEGRRYFLAILFVSLTVMFHFETGYLALLPLALFPFLNVSEMWLRFRRAVIVAGAVCLATAWVTVPLLLSSKWASVNEILRGTPLENGYGARQVMKWLLTGQLLDSGRLPVVTLLAAVGLITCIVNFRRDQRSRAVIVLLVMSLILAFGRTTFGSLVDVIPGSTDIFMRRFMMGVQLAALLLAGIGAATAGALLVREARERLPGLVAGVESRAWIRRSAVVGAIVVALLALAPAWSQIVSRDRDNGRAIKYQQEADTELGARIAPLLERVRRSGNGRVYAGLPDNWGTRFTVGSVPVFKYLESLDIDEVGYTLRTASLMTDPEYFFDQGNIGDYTIFGVRYILEPAGRRPPVPARLVMLRTPYALWEVKSVDYFHVAKDVGTLAADRSDVGLRSAAYLRSPLPGMGEALAVDFAGAHSGISRTGDAYPTRPAGTVISAKAEFDMGTAQAVVRLHERALVVLSTSFDPGWQVQVDGRSAATAIVAPALVAVEIGPGTHRVVFTYVGFRYYVPLFVVSGLVLVSSLILDRRYRARRPEGLAVCSGASGGTRSGPRSGPGSGTGTRSGPAPRSGPGPGSGTGTRSSSGTRSGPGPGTRSGPGAP